jgi:hypothetical protein
MTATSPAGIPQRSRPRTGERLRVCQPRTVGLHHCPESCPRRSRTRFTGHQSGDWVGTTDLLNPILGVDHVNTALLFVL